MRVYLSSLGCRLNTSEIEWLARCFAEAGHHVVADAASAELLVFNSCTVTAPAAQKSRNALRRLSAANPTARIIATGCLAELSRDEVGRLGADLVVGNQDKDRLLELAEVNGLLRAADPPTLTTRPPAPVTTRRTRAFIKVQDGCDNRCAYCVVTVARGPGRSVPPDIVLQRIAQALAEGVKEVVLTGVHLGSFGRDRGDRRGLAGLVEAILARTDLPRLRLSSLEPWDVQPELLELFASPRLLPHLHLPVQSGCDATLARMARPCSSGQYAELVARAAATIPDLCVSSDVLVAFPGETDAEHQASLRFVQDCGIASLHVFRYSRREGTPAARMPAQVPPQLARSRSEEMRLLSRRLQQEYAQRFLGRSLAVLWERATPTPTGVRWSGLTPNYLRVVTETASEHDLANQVTLARLERVGREGLLARVVASDGRDG